jgi:hypothetical protein
MVLTGMKNLLTRYEIVMLQVEWILISPDCRDYVKYMMMNTN